MENNKPVSMSNLEIHAPKFFLQLIFLKISGECETSWSGLIEFISYKARKMFFVAGVV